MIPENNRTDRNPFDQQVEKSIVLPRAKLLTPITILGTGISYPLAVMRVGDIGYAPIRSLTQDLAQASRRAMDRAGVRIDDIGAVILSTISGDDVIAGSRGLLARELGMRGQHVVELNAESTGFMEALSVGRDRAAVYGDKILVVAGDIFQTKFTNPGDDMSCELFGDGSAAAVLGPCEEGFGLKIGRTINYADLREDAVIDDNKRYFKMNVAALGTRIPAIFCEQYLVGCAQNGFNPANTIAIPHQADSVLLESLVEKLGIDSNNLVNVFNKYGDCVNASIGIALHHAFVDGKLTRGTNALLFGAGAGFNAGYLGFTADGKLPEQIPYRVLFIDDEHEVANTTIEQMLSLYNKDDEFRRIYKFDPVVEYSAEGGIRRMMGDNSINLIVTDQRMGAMSGSDMVMILKHRVKDVGYVLVTGFAEQDRSKIEKVGFSAIISKPYDREKLWSVVKNGAYSLYNRDR